MKNQIFVDVVFNADGSVDSSKTTEAFHKLLATFASQINNDFDKVSVEITAFLLENPSLRSISSSALSRSIWERRLEAGELKGKSTDEKTAEFTRLEEVVPNYVKSQPDMFHVGRKTGIAIRYVLGENAVDGQGNTVYDGEGNPVQAYRVSDDDWAKMTAKKEKPEEKAAA